MILWNNFNWWETGPWRFTVRSHAHFDDFPPALSGHIGLWYLGGKLRAFSSSELPRICHLCFYGHDGQPVNKSCALVTFICSFRGAILRKAKALEFGAPVPFPSLLTYITKHLFYHYILSETGYQTLC